MSLNYSAPLPNDKNGAVMQGFPPPLKAKASYGTNNATASSVITLTDNSTMVEITANGSPVAVRWIPVTETASVSPFASVISTGSTANFDYVVAKDDTRRFVAPIETQGTGSIVGIGVQAGTYRRIAVMSGVAVSSIMVSEF